MEQCDVHNSCSCFLLENRNSFSHDLFQIVEKEHAKKKIVVNTKQPCLLQYASNIGEELAREKIINCASHGSRHSRSSMLFTHQLVVPPIMERIGRMRSSQDSERERSFAPQRRMPFSLLSFEAGMQQGRDKGRERRRQTSQSRSVFHADDMFHPERHKE